MSVIRFTFSDHQILSRIQEKIMKTGLVDRMRRSSLLLVLIMTIGLLSCTASQKNTMQIDTRVPMDISFISGKSSLPNIDSLEFRSLSGTADISPNKPAKDKKSGSDMKSAGVTLASPLNVTTKAGEFQWIIYSYGPCSSSNKPLDFTVNLTGSSGPIWYAVSNYTNKTWEWHVMTKASYANENNVYNDKNQYYNSSNGASYIALVAYNGSNLKFTGGNVNTTGDFPTGPAIVQPINWSFHFIEEGSSVGTVNAVEVINNTPAVVYNDTNKHQVKYAYGIEELPKSSSDWKKMTVDGSSSAKRGGTLDLNVWKNRPMISYEAPTDQRVYFAYAKSSAPGVQADWNKYIPTKDGRSAPQLFIDSTGPAMMMIDLSAGIKYIHSTTAEIPIDSTFWTSLDTVDKLDGSYLTPYSNIADDKAIVAYQRLKDGFNELRFTYNTAPSKWTITTVDSIDITADTSNAGINPVLKLWKDGMAIAYGNKLTVGNQTLQYAYTTTKNPKPTDWKLHQVSKIYKSDVGKDLGLAFYFDIPVMFYNNGDSALHIAVAKSSTPTSDADWDFGILEQAIIGYSINGSCSPIMLADGSLGLVYRTGQGLKFAYYIPSL